MDKVAIVLSTDGYEISIHKVFGAGHIADEYIENNKPDCGCCEYVVKEKEVIWSAD